MSTRTETLTDWPLGHVWRRARGVYLAQWIAHTEEPADDVVWDAFPTERAAKRYVEEDREDGGGYTVRDLRWKLTGPRWECTATVTREMPDPEDYVP